MKLFLMFLFICGVFLGKAQAPDTALSQYAGTYNFPSGSFITSATVSLDSNVLNVNSAQGSSPLEMKGKDTFALVNYDGGMVYFFRNDQGKVARIKVAVQDILLEGTKSNVTAWLNKNYYMHPGKQLPVK